MVVAEEQVKRCKLCGRVLPLIHFHKSRVGKYSSRCKQCHGLAVRKCVSCCRLFIGKQGRKACSDLCRQLMQSPTFVICRHCNNVFGPVSHLTRIYCSQSCARSAARTGRKTFRRTVAKARSAQSLLRYHVQAGNIKRPTICEECGANDRRIEGAHFNYDEPLRVRWLCVSCHRRWDKREPKGATFVVSGRNELRGSDA